MGKTGGLTRVLIADDLAHVREGAVPSWKACRRSVTRKLAAADRTAEAFFTSGIERWETEGKLGSSQAAMLRAHLSSGQAQDALHHLGIHLLLSAPIPIPGLQNLARLSWTLAFMVVDQVKSIRHRAAGPAAWLPNIHTPLVLALSLLPGLGRFAYLAARPLWNKLLMRLALDQVAWMPPFGLYGLMGLGRLLSPIPLPELHDASVVYTGA
ncbi:MAG: hypothetical protein QF714_10210 [Dehalococcoidia bacterium]|jgi:hypothetical protein|nr:hypothetical protein [Dehalococcoidia bacterium]MDP7085478.1 hypothetical protein [Dehalococcoidia bacterium]|tara:strand:- start:479 stop:1111 length:633 start_codon:yes stop_codon:yes gene_type:complete